MNEPVNTPFLSTERAADYLTLSPVTLKNMRVRGDGPPFLRLGRKRIVYDIATLNEWARGQQVTTTDGRRRAA